VTGPQNVENNCIMMREQQQQMRSDWQIGKAGIKVQQS
jgi:hypothetical protein